MSFPVSRRDALRATALAAAGVSLPTIATAATTPAAMAPRPRPGSPEQALARLVAGNGRFVAGAPQQPRRDAARLMAVANGQQPYAGILTCADSRVPVEILFDEGVGDLFVTRVAGNIATAEIIGSLEYGAGVLGTQVILVLGHTSCGAVSAAVAGKAVPGQISGLFAGLLPAIEQAPNDVEAAIAANVRHQVRVLERGSPLLAERVAAGQLAIRGGVVELATGRVSLL